MAQERLKWAFKAELLDALARAMKRNNFILEIEIMILVDRLRNIAYMNADYHPPANQSEILRDIERLVKKIVTK